MRQWSNESDTEIGIEDGVSPPSMDAPDAVIADLRRQGFTTDLWADENGMLLCGSCAARYDPEHAEVVELHRFEGSSDPGDESILFAVRAPCGHHGIFTTAFGPNTPTDEAAIAHRLRLKMGTQGASASASSGGANQASRRSNP